MLHYFRTEQEFLEIYRELFKAYREGYYISNSGVDRALSDLSTQGYKRFGWSDMTFRIKKEMKKIREQVDKEVGWVSPFQQT